MPRNISSSGKDTDKTSVLSFLKPSGNTILIIMVVVTLLWNSANDAYGKVENEQANLVQKSKVCMADYTGTGCDALALTPKCGELFNYIQLTFTHQNSLQQLLSSRTYVDQSPSLSPPSLSILLHR